MTAGDLLTMLTRHARKFRMERTYFERNQHMHSMKTTPDQVVVDSLVTGFINYVGMQLGVDYALYSEDLHSGLNPDPAKPIKESSGLETQG